MASQCTYPSFLRKFPWLQHWKKRFTLFVNKQIATDQARCFKVMYLGQRVAKLWAIKAGGSKNVWVACTWFPNNAIIWVLTSHNMAVLWPTGTCSTYGKVRSVDVYWIQSKCLCCHFKGTLCLSKVTPPFIVVTYFLGVCIYFPGLHIHNR